MIYSNKNLIITRQNYYKSTTFGELYDYKN